MKKLTHSKIQIWTFLGLILAANAALFAWCFFDVSFHHIAWFGGGAGLFGLVAVFFERLESAKGDGTSPQ